MAQNKDLRDIKEDFISYFQENYLYTEIKPEHLGALPPGYSNTNNFLGSHHCHLKE